MYLQKYWQADTNNIGVKRRVQKTSITVLYFDIVAETKEMKAITIEDILKKAAQLSVRRRLKMNTQDVRKSEKCMWISSDAED